LTVETWSLYMAW